MKLKALVAAVIFSLFTTSAFAHAHLIFGKGKLHAHASWVKGPATSGESILRLEWKSGLDHSPVEPAGKFKVDLWMPDMNHGSAPTQLNRVVDTAGDAVKGSYDVKNMFFVMGGRWQVRVHYTDVDGTKETQLFEVKLDGSGHGHGH